jgi:hypothetical protein
MSNLTFAFITPSYAPDFQRCQLLCWSIKKFVAFPVKHYIVVDQKDFALFQQLADENTVILLKENILPSWIKRIPFYDKKNLWLNLKGYKNNNWLIRGWLIQQIIKLAAAQYAEEEVLVFLDSDVAFMEPFDVSSLIQQDKVRLFRVDHKTDHDNEIGKRWKDAAKQLLGLPLEKEYFDFYVSQIVTWRRSTLLQMYSLIEKNFQQNWMEVLCGMKNLSEYVVYGLFANYVLGESAGHYDDHLQKICECYWETDLMTPEELVAFFRRAKAEGYRAVMISAKSPINLTIEQFESLLAKSAIETTEISAN